MTRCYGLWLIDILCKALWNVVRWFISILYISCLSKWWLITTKLSFNPGQLNSYAWLSTLLHICTTCFPYLYSVYLHSQTKFVATMTHWTGFRWQDVMAFAYVTFYVKPCVIWIRLFITVLYIMSSPGGDVLELSIAPTLAGCIGVLVLSVLSCIELGHFRSNRDSSKLQFCFFFPSYWMKSCWFLCYLEGPQGVCPLYYYFWIYHLECFPEWHCEVSECWVFKIHFPTWIIIMVSDQPKLAYTCLRYAWMTFCMCILYRDCYRVVDQETYTCQYVWVSFWARWVKGAN